MVQFKGLVLTYIQEADGTWLATHSVTAALGTGPTKEAAAADVITYMGRTMEFLRKHRADLGERLSQDLAWMEEHEVS